MTVELITGSRAIQDRIGIDPEENTLQSGIFREAPRDRLPVLAVMEGKSYGLIVRRLELGNYIAGGRAAWAVAAHGVRLTAYDPYFTMSETGGEFPVYADEGQALRDGWGIGRALVHPDMPYGRYRRISDTVETVLARDEEQPERFLAYEVDLSYVSEVFCRADPQDIRRAMELLEECTHVAKENREILLREMNAPRADPFGLLSGMMREQGIGCIWADTQLTIHTLTALPWDEIEAGRMFACYDGQRVLFFSSVEKAFPFLRKTGEYGSYDEMAGAVLGDREVGIEWKSLPVGRALPIRGPLADASAMLTLWRDRHAHQFLPYYTINGIATVYAMEQTCAWAREAVASGSSATERDADRRYEELLEEFRMLHRLDGLALQKYFVVLHAGTRCPFPALSSDYPLSRGMKTLKIDAGATLFKDGILMSATDQCRCLCLTPEAQRVYELLGENIRRDVIPRIRGGMRGREVYWLGLGPLAEQEQELKSLGMLDPDFSLADSYNRNIGHTIDKEESCSVAADKGDGRVFETRMVGCIEYQWPYRDYCIGVEDMFYLAPEGGIDFVF